VSFPVLGSAIAASSKAFPLLRGSVQVSSQTSGASFAPTIPTHSSGNVILVVVAYEAADHGSLPVALGSPAGWTKKYELLGSAIGDCGMALFTRTATTSAHTISIPNSNGQGAVAHVYVLQNAQGTVDATGTSGNNPPSQTTSWGSDLNYWLVAEACTNSGPTVGPTGFGNSVQTNPGTTQIYLTTMDKNDTSATLDPSAFTGGTAAAQSATIVVRPT
jgi:hypothetical protein